MSIYFVDLTLMEKKNDKAEYAKKLRTWDSIIF
jgi:hypothetical protein